MVEQDPEKVAIAEEQKDIEEMLGNASNIVDLVSGVDYDGKVENVSYLIYLPLWKYTTLKINFLSDLIADDTIGEGEVRSGADLLDELILL